MIRYPKPISIQGIEPLDSRSIFEERGGVRIDNAGPFPVKEVVKLRNWLGRFITAALEAKAQRGR